MKLEKKTVLAGALLIVALIMIVMRLSFPDRYSPDLEMEPVAQSENRAQTRATTLEVPRADSQIQDGVPHGEKSGHQVSPITRDAALEKMHEAAVTYDPAELQVIRPYLENPDPELRAYAVEAIIILGDSSAGPMLREAAKKLASPEEALKMEQAADYIELPPANLKQISEFIKSRTPEEQDADVEIRSGE